MAIIGVLVAIAIPVFSSQLEKSREAVDFSSIRSAYSELMTAVMADDESAVFNGKPIRQSDGVYKVTVSPLKQQKDGFDTNISEMSIGGVSSSEWVGSPKAAGTATVEYIPNLEKLTISWGNTYGYKYSSMASSDFADKTVPLTPETADQRMAADIDAVSSIASCFLGMTKEEILEATGLPSEYQGRLNNNEGTAILTYRNQNGTNPQIRGNVEHLRELGYSGDISAPASNSFSNSANRTFFSDYMNSGAEAHVKIGKIKYDKNDKAVSVTAWVERVNNNGGDVPSELKNIVVTSD